MKQEKETYDAIYSFNYHTAPSFSSQ